MARVPQNVEPKKPWSQQADQKPEAMAVHREQSDANREIVAEGKSVPRKAISLGDFDGIKRDVDEGKDHLFIPEHLKPDGIALEWKRHSVLNKEDKKHRAEVWRAGWRYVPSNSEGFAEHFASFIAGDIFEYEGLVLMYRPKTMSDTAKKEEARKAGALVQDKMEEMGMTSEYRDIPGKKFKLERGFEEKVPGGNPAAISVPE